MSLVELKSPHSFPNAYSQKIPSHAASTRASIIQTKYIMVCSNKLRLDMFKQLHSQ